jgi:hypothetical protein
MNVIFNVISLLRVSVNATLWNLHVFHWTWSRDFFFFRCSHLEQRASVKPFVSLQFINLRQSVGLLGRVISTSQGRYLTQTQNKHRQDIHAPSGIRSHDRSVRARPRGHCDRLSSDSDLLYLTGKTGYGTFRPLHRMINTDPVSETLCIKYSRRWTVFTMVLTVVVIDVSFHGTRLGHQAIVIR